MPEVNETAITPVETPTPPPEAADKAILDEIKTGKHYFNIRHAKTRLYFQWPSNAVEEKSNWFYSKTYMRGVQEGLPLEDELLKMITSKGLWTDAEQSKLDKVLAEYYVTAAKALNEPENVALAKLKSELESEAIRLRSKRRRYTLNCVEEKAEETKKFFVISQITMKEDGTPVWPSYEEFQKDLNKPWIYEIYWEYSFWQNNLPESFFGE